MYRFADLTHEQKLNRRELLDYYGLLAQVSVVIPLLIVAFTRLSSVVWARLDNGQVTQIPSSPYAKAARLGHARGLNRLKAAWRKFYWRCGDHVLIAGTELGTKGEIIAAVAFTAWLTFLTFVETGDDYLHLTKRAGAVAASQLPFHYLLSLKSPYSPIQYITGSSNAQLISIHQSLGRIITGFFWVHTALYINFYVISSLLWRKLKELYIICGIAAILAFTIVGTSSLKPVRVWSYRVFSIVHVAVATALLPVLYFHVHHIRVYLYETLAVYVLNAILRYFSTKTHAASIKKVQGTDLVEISVPLTKGLNRWQPGQHAYISLQNHPLLRTFRSNPFTVASIPQFDGHLRFIARILDGNTSRLAQNVKESQKISVEGPYGLATHTDKLLTYDRVLFVAGGVGATFIAPLYRQLLSDLSPSKGSTRRQKVDFIWVARSLADVAWAIDSLKDEEKSGFLERLQVHLTRDPEHATMGQSNATFTIGEDDEVPGEEGIELEERKNLLNEAAAGGDGKTEASVDVSPLAGRPDLAAMIGSVFAHSSSERVAIMVCGPRSLSRDVRHEVGRFVVRGRDVWIHNEAFGT